jgi:lincosamide nucleotidyltransferase A/C/D/E
MMTAEDVGQIVAQVESGGFDFWLDGGWGVDALAREQTREHDDLDMVVLLEDTDRLIEVLGAAEFTVTLDARPTRFVMSDGGGRRIDLHPVVFEADGGARQIGAMPGGGDAPYPAWGFAGKGAIGGRAVRCLSPRLLVLHHMGYEPQEKDRHNVRVLCERFGFAPPRGYE